MQKNWLIVADEAVAHVFEWQGADKQLQEVETLTHPAAHAQEADLRHDAQGRNAQGRKAGHARGIVSSVTSSASLDLQHREGVEFARQVAEWLGRAHQEGRFHHLKVAAAPRFLGLLRQSMQPQVSAVILDELPKDLVHESRADLERRFLNQAGSQAVHKVK
jgi:protein required for attachment to host cells